MCHNKKEKQNKRNNNHAQTQVLLLFFSSFFFFFSFPFLSYLHVTNLKLGWFTLNTPELAKGTPESSLQTTTAPSTNEALRVVFLVQSSGNG
jgi:hypothetical protein